MEGNGTIEYSQIGVIHSPFKTPKGTPIQPGTSQGRQGIVEIFPEYVEGLEHLDGFSHIILLYHFHRVKGSTLLVRPFLDEQDHGVFATRAPNRPNSIGLSVVKLRSIDNGNIRVEGLDIVDGTPLLDLKPYVPEFDQRHPVDIGWISKNINRLDDIFDDGRFV